MKDKTSIICLIICFVCGIMLFKAATDEPLYYALNIDQLGNEYITDQNLTWEDCQAIPHVECNRMSELEEL